MGLHLAFTISADPSQAQAALAGLKTASVTGAADISSAWSQAMNALTRPTSTALGAFEDLQQKSQVLRQEFILQHRTLRLLATEGYGGLVPAFQAAAASLTDFRNLSLEALNAFEQGMGSSVALAIVYSKSIGEAMASALKATLTSLAAEAYIQAIKAAALGFLRLAEYDFAAAAEAFESAGLWAAVGTAAGLAGRAVSSTGAERRATPGFGGLVLGPGRAGEAAGLGAAPLAAGVPAAGRPGGAGGQGVTVIFQGPVYGGKAGLDELIGHISDAVDRRDVRLSATTIKDATLTRDSFNG